MSKKGSVLMISLWILAILVVFALGLGQRAAINLRLAKYQRDRLKATCLARAGINRAIAELKKDAKKTAYDSLTEPWNKGFKDVEIIENSGEKFTIQMVDEDGKININEIATPEKEQILVKLFESGGIVNQDELEELKNLFLKWGGKTPLSEEEAKQGIIKNKPLKSPEEILVILEYFYEPKEGLDTYRQKAQEIFNKINGLITIYPLKININTVSSDILTILAKSVSQDTDPSILIAEIQKNTFANQEAIDNFTINDPKAQEIYNNIKSFFTYQSTYFKIVSQGKVGQISKAVTAIYDRSGEGKIVYWHEN